MARLWRFRIAFLLVASGLAAPVRAETIEFVTYYPAPIAQGGSNMEAMAIGNGYEGVTPDDGELLVFDRLGVGPGFDVAQPAGRLHVQGSANAANTAVFMPGAGGTMNVGIGTANPKTALDVRQHLNLEDGNGAGVIYFRNTQINPQVPIGLFIRSDNDPTTFEAASERMFIGANGNVGIGTTAPADLLHVHRPGNNPSSARFTDDESGGTGNDGVAVGYGSIGGGNLGFLWNRENSALSFGTANTEKMRINANGNVGIGTTGPSQKLHVYEPAAGVWATQIQSNQYGLYANASIFGLYGAATSTGGIAAYGINTSYGNQGGFGWGDIGMYCYTPRANWAGLSWGSYYGHYAYGSYYGMYAQNGTYWQPALFAYNGGSGYWSYIGYGYYGLYTNGYVHGYLQNASSINLKRDVSSLSPQEEASILSRIQEFPLVRYRLKTDSEDHPLRLGVIAEWTPKELTSDDGKAVDVSAYISYSMAGVKALSVQVKQQREEIRKLKQQVQQLCEERAP